MTSYTTYFCLHENRKSNKSCEEKFIIAVSKYLESLSKNLPVISSVVLPLKISLPFIKLLKSLFFSSTEGGGGGNYDCKWSFK